MKVISYDYNLKSINIKFDCVFKQIKIIKLESNENELNGELINDEIEMSFSKEKDTINLFINEPKLIIIYINELDKQKISYSYLINLKSTLPMSTSETIDIPLSLEVVKECDQKLDVRCPIKNQNIFAKITKKVYC